MVTSGGRLWLMSCRTITGVVVAGAGKTSILFVGKLRLALGVLPFFSPSFVLFIRSSVVIFAFFILVTVVALSLSGTLCWDVTSGLAFRAIG